MAHLYIHIGAKKTGSTSIQTALKTNSSLLQSEGFFVDNRSGATEDIIFPRKYMAEKSDSQPVDSWFSTAVEFIKEKGQSAIISAESLSDMRVAEIKRFREDIPKYFSELKIIYFIRRQDLAAVSHYSTALKGGGTSKALFSTTMGRRGKRGFHYGRVADDWASVFGKESVSIHVYPDNQTSNWDAISEFVGIPGLEPLKKILKVSKNKNVSLSRNVAAYLRKYNELAKAGIVENSLSARNRFVSSLSDIADGHRVPLPQKSDAQSFLKSFRAENKKLKLEYLPNYERLFSSDFSMYPECRIDLDSFVDEKLFQERVKNFQI